MCRPKLCLEVWQGENHRAQDVDPSSLESLILEMASAGSAVLSIVVGQRSLVVSAGHRMTAGGASARPLEPRGRAEAAMTEGLRETR